jgi:GNAT superfamily N-acetyltransferase
MAATDPHALPEGIQIRPLTGGDVDAGLVLSREAGWNQAAEDWIWMIEAGRGWACSDDSGTVIATALTLPASGEFGWISMVLVTEAWRRRGIASALMARSIDELRKAGKVPGLDATPAGRTVYGPLGFKDIYGLTRLRAERAMPAAHGTKIPCRPMTIGDLPALTGLDCRAFRADRQTLLGDLCRRAPELAWVAEAKDGFCLGRNGRGAWQLGPVVATDPATAIALVASALGSIEVPVMIDVPDHHLGLTDWLQRSGFHAQRPYTRMLLSRDQPFDDPGLTYAITGPELG